MVVVAIGHDVKLSPKEKLILLKANPDNRQIAIDDLSYQIMGQTTDETLQDYDDVRTQVVSAIYEELLTDIEIIHHESLPIDNIIEKI